MIEIISVLTTVGLVILIYIFKGVNCPLCGGKMYEDITFDETTYRCYKCDIKNKT